MSSEKMKNLLLVFLAIFLACWGRVYGADSAPPVIEVSNDHFHLDRLNLSLEPGFAIDVSAFTRKPPYRYCTTLAPDYCTYWDKPNVPVYLDYSADALFEEVLKEAIKTWNMGMGLRLHYAGRIRVKDAVEKCVLWKTGYENREGIFVTPVRREEETYSCLGNAIGISWTVGIGGIFEYAIIYIEYVRGDYGFSDLFPPVMHELGHAIGLDHPFEHNEDNTFSIMNYYDKSATHLTYNDLDVIQYVYGPPWGDRGDFSIRTAWILNDLGYEEGRPTHYCIFGGTPSFSISNSSGDKDYPFCFYVSDLDAVVTVKDSTGDTCQFLPSIHVNDENLAKVCDTVSGGTEESSCHLVMEPDHPGEIERQSVGEGLRYLGADFSGTKRYTFDICFNKDVFVTMALLVEGSWELFWYRPDCVPGFGVSRTRNLKCTIEVPSYYARSYLLILLSEGNFTFDAFDWGSTPYKILVIKLF